LFVLDADELYPAVAYPLKTLSSLNTRENPTKLFFIEDRALQIKNSRGVLENKTNFF